MPADREALRLEDRERIREVLYRYSRAIDRRDLDLMMSCYHPDSVDQHASFTGSGPEFCSYAMAQLKRSIFTQHRITNILIDFDGDRAFTECYVHAIHRVRSNAGLVDYVHCGRYCDILELRAGEWRLAYRLHIPDGDSFGPIQEPEGRRSVGEEPTRYYVRGRAGPDDASYLKFEIPALRRDVPPIDVAHSRND